MIDQSSEINLLSTESFKATHDGQEVALYTLTNANGCVAQITNYGARIVALCVPDKEGKMRDVVLGFSSISEYLTTNDKYHGAIIGRYANRIAKGRFILDNKTYRLALNNDTNHLHGGEKGFESRVWSVAQKQTHKITLTYTSKHLEEGYPGNLTVQVLYELTDDNALTIEYKAVTDQNTVVNLTNHAFFNLKGEGNGSILDHYMKIPANNFIPVNADLIPTGKLDPVEGTPFDFRNAKRIKDEINSSYEQLVIAKGYDHSYVLQNNGQLAFAAEVLEKSSGIQMKVLTDQPGMQLYTGNFLDGSSIGKSGQAYQKRDAFCLETQHYPDSPNQDLFPSTILTPQEEYRSTTVYKFGIGG
ncbi:MAG: aldose epimerase family protein [Bacteroidota bacterium]